MLAAFVLLIECMVLAFLQANGMDARPALAMLVVIGIFTLAYFWDIGRSSRLKPVLPPLVLGYLMRLALLVFDIYGRDVYSLPNSGSDTEMFYHYAVQKAMFGDGGRGGLMSEILGTVFGWTGVSRLFGQFLLMLCSVAALHIAERIMEEMQVETRHRIRAMYILCLLPNFAILSVIFLRESPVAMFVALSLLCFVRWFQGKREYWFWLAFAFTFCASAFHSGTVATAVGYIVVRFLYDRSKRSFRFTWKNILPAVIFLFVFLFLFNNYGDRFFEKMLKIESIEDIASGAGMGGSTYAQYVGDSSTPLNMVLYTPFRVVFFLFSPFPWHWRGLPDIIAFCFNSAFYLWSIFSALRYLLKRRVEHKNMVTAILIVAVCTVFVFAWGCSNTGTAVRHRDKMVILYGVLLGLSWQRPRRMVRGWHGGEELR